MKEMRLHPNEESKANQEDKEAKSGYFPNGVADPGMNHETDAEGKGKGNATYYHSGKGGGEGGGDNIGEMHCVPNLFAFFLEYLIEPTKLYSLMNERCTSFLLLDIRSASDYKSCRIEHPTSINVPEELLQPGTVLNNKR